MLNSFAKTSSTEDSRHLEGRICICSFLSSFALRLISSRFVMEQRCCLDLAFIRRRTTHCACICTMSFSGSATHKYAVNILWIACASPLSARMTRLGSSSLRRNDSDLFSCGKIESVRPSSRLFVAPLTSEMLSKNQGNRPTLASFFAVLANTRRSCMRHARYFGLCGLIAAQLRRDANPAHSTA